MNKKPCNVLLPLVQLLPAVTAAAAVLFALPRTVPVLAAVSERLTAVVEQPVEAAFSEAEEEALPKLPYADGVYVGSSRGYGGAVRVQVTMENGSITEVEILDASHETRQFLRRAKRLLTTVVEAQSWEVDAVSGATYSSTGILNAVKLALAKAAIVPAEEAAPEQAASEEAVEEAAPSEVPEPEETPVTAPTVEVVQPEEKSAVPVWLKEVWQQFFPADAPASSEPEPASSEEVLPTSEPALPPEETGIESETEGAAE